MDIKTEIDASRPDLALVQLSVLFAGTLSFAKGIVAHARASGALDDETLAGIKAQCILRLKDTGVQGLPMQDEALALRQAIEHLEQLFDGIQ